MLQRATGRLDAPVAIAFVLAMTGAASGQMQDAAAVVPGDRPASPTWLDPQGGSCATEQYYLASLAALGINPIDMQCVAAGPCDTPGVRNAAIPTPSSGFKTIRLTINVFCENNGSNPTATQAQVDTAVALLNQNFAIWNIGFVAQTRSINNSTHRTLEDPFNDQVAMKQAYASAPGSSLNVYVVYTAGGNAWGTMPWSSWALGAQGGIVIHAPSFTQGTRTLTHEVGHCLGLWHVFRGVDEVETCGPCYEAAGRTPEQGDVTGDFCSDTNPTPQNTGNCSDPVGLDPCTGLEWLQTPYLNYMAYTAFSCRTEFTPQQAGRMHCWSAQALSGWLYTPMTPPAPGTPALSKSGAIRVAWADNSYDEDGFVVQRERKQGGNWVDTTTLPALAPNTTSMLNTPPLAGTFRYRVRAFNELGNSAWSGWAQIKY